jgi:hypothetical protein
MQMQVSLECANVHLIFTQHRIIVVHLLPLLLLLFVMALSLAVYHNCM